MESKSKLPEYRRRANQAYDEKHTETLGLKFKKGVKEKMKTVADRSGQSLTSYLVAALKEKAIREGILTEEQASTLLDEDHEGAWIRAYLSE